MTLHRNGLEDQAEKAYAEALQIYPNFADARYNLGALYLGRGQYEKARACYGEVVRRNPDYAKGRRALALLEIEGGNAQDGVAQLEQLIADQPLYIAAYESLALALLELGQWKRAGRIVADGLRTKPEHQGLLRLRRLIEGRR